MVVHSSDPKHRLYEKCSFKFKYSDSAQLNYKAHTVKLCLQLVE